MWERAKERWGRGEDSGVESLIQDGEEDYGFISKAARADAKAEDDLDKMTAYVPDLESKVERCGITWCIQ